MSVELYVVFSPGRTGSHIITEVLAGAPGETGGLCNTMPYWYEQPDSQFDIDKQRVIKTHNLNVIKELNLNPKDITLVLSQRRDMFAQLMSWIVAELTNEWSGKDYTDKIVTPAMIPKARFKELYYEVNHWPNTIPKHNQFKKVVTIYYEDIIGNDKAQHIANILDIEYNESNAGTVYRKSPYSYKDCILNWKELKNLYDGLTANK